eukprot:scaffold35090_cov67-Phaeocystis_antarctica.AAC.1
MPTRPRISGSKHHSPVELQSCLATARSYRTHRALTHEDLPTVQRSTIYCHKLLPSLDLQRMATFKSCAQPYVQLSYPTTTERAPCSRVKPQRTPSISRVSPAV